MNEKNIEEALITLILSSLLEIDNPHQVANYKFDMKIFNNRVKGVIKVKFEEVE